MPVTKQAPPPAQPWRGDPAPFAPHLTTKGQCSVCEVEAIAAADNTLKICPTCFAVLWHVDFTAEYRREQERRQQSLAAKRDADIRRREQRREQRRIMYEAEGKPDKEGA